MFVNMGGARWYLAVPAMREGGKSDDDDAAKKKDQNDDDSGKSKSDADDDKSGGGKARTQEEIDKIVQERLARQEKTLRKQWEEEQAEAKRKAEMTEAERAKAEKAEAEKKVSETEGKANQRIIQAEAKVVALAAGIKPERVAAALKLANLSGVTIGDDGEPDAGALKKAVEAVLKDFPEFKAGTSSGGSDFNGGSGGEPTAEQIANMSMDDYIAWRNKKKT